MIFEKKVVGMYRAWLHGRCDDTGRIYYFSANDFEGLKAEPFAFKSNEGATLKGYFYSYEGYDASRLIVFDHGFGGGHRAYMKEIERLCRAGYRVFSYDHTGCMESEGESTRGFAQSLSDLNACITALKSSEAANGAAISVVGHSWGGFSTLNISAIHKEITHIVAMCGFVSVEEMINTFFSGIMKGYRKAILALERESNPRFVEFNAVETLKNSKTKALLIYSEDDQMCRRKHYDILKSGLEGRENIDFLFVKNKGHNPNYTEDAVKYLGEFGKARAKLARKKNVSKEEKAQFVASYDWERMTAQDDAVWQKIFEHLDN